MLKYILSLTSIGVYFIAPLSYIYFYHLSGNSEEKYNFIPLALFFMLIVIMIFVLTKIIFKIKKLYYFKLFIITIEIIAVLYVGVQFFEYITFNAIDIQEFLEFCMLTTLLGTIPMILLLRNLSKNNII